MQAERDYKKEGHCLNCGKAIIDISMDMGFIWVHKDTMKKECIKGE